MSRLQLRGVFETLNLDIPLESVVVVNSPDGSAAHRLAFGLIAAQAQRKMAPLLAPTWLPAVSQLATTETGEVLGLRPTFVFRHTDSRWQANTRVGQVLGIVSLLAKCHGVSSDALCEVCAGAGDRASVVSDLLVVDSSKSLAEGAIAPWAEWNSRFYLGVLDSLASQIGLDLAVPWRDLGSAMKDVVLYGNPESNYQGVVHDVERRLARAGEGRGTDSIDSLTPYLEWQDCEACEGTGHSEGATSTRGMSWSHLYRLPIGEALARTENLISGDAQSRQLALRVKRARAFGLASLPIGYRASRLSDREARQLRLAEVLGSGLQGALYVLEAPFREFEQSVQASALAFVRQRVEQGDSFLIASSTRFLTEGCDWLIELDDRAEDGTVEVAYAGRPEGR